MDRLWLVQIKMAVFVFILLVRRKPVLGHEACSKTHGTVLMSPLPFVLGEMELLAQRTERYERHCLTCHQHPISD